MILDKELQFSDAQAVTASAASTNIVDLGPVGPSGYAVGSPDAEVFIELDIDTTFTANGSATMSVAVQSDNDEAFGTPTTHFTTPVAAVAAMTAGARPWPRIRIPLDAERYVRLYYTVATGPMTAGAISATGGLGPQTNR